MAWCNKHNREMLKSKYGENQFWCPDCSNEKKEAGGFQKAEKPTDKQHEEIMEEFKKLNKRIDGLAQFLGESK